MNLAEILELTKVVNTPFVPGCLFQTTAPPPKAKLTDIGQTLGI
jgi:hypothetical protein